MLANIVAGRAAPAEGGLRSDIVDPCTEELIARAPLSRQSDVDGAVTAAAQALRSWRDTTPAERSRALLRIAQAVEDSAAELTELECRNTGKPRLATLSEEIEPVVDQLRFFAGAARTLEGRAVAEYLPGHTSMVRREPVGVCAQIAPWNYPLMMAAWKIGPALAAGNTVVLKPAETTPLTALRLAELAAAHLPPGVFNVVCGDRETGRLLAAHRDVALVSLTGSVRAGREVAGSAGPALKRLHLELGGNCPAVVLDDADLQAAADGIAMAAFFNAGQDCVAASRVLVSERSYAGMVDALTQRAKQTVTGPPADPDPDYGPLNNADQLARVTGLVDRLPGHAEVRTGGHRVGDVGYFYAPTVVAGVRQSDELVREEAFGPVVTVQPFASPDEAIQLANGVPQALAASVWTRDHRTALRFARDLEAGCVWINTHLRFAAEMPHGGFRDSGYGKDLSGYAVEDYTRVKHVMTAL
ncbi:MAG TPA: aminobutyraldehyde dehydrogenase [Micromonosporaceae bacterium]|nr:aminobutyraldehyde dehydrogenase [Micromonosporaceae bacterium]